MLPSGECEVPFHHLSTREIDLVSSFRQNNVFGMAVDMLVSGRVDPKPILTAAFPLEAGSDAFEASLDRETNIKVIFVAGERHAGASTGDAIN
jgi:L-idonate 5-dehydrogenase